MGGGVSKTKTDNFPKLGIKVSYLDTFINSIGGEIVLKDLSTATLVEKILKPLLDKEETTTSYCQQLLIEKNTNIGQASVIIIHSWYNVFIDVINTIKYHFYNEPNTIIWFDMFSLDLHKEISNFDEFCNSYKNTIKNFNYVVLVLPKWEQKDSILSRLWCNYELYCTENNNCKFEIAMLNEQQQALFFKEVLYDTINTIEKIKIMINCENCKCYYLYKDKLLQIMNKIGYKNCNDNIYNLIQNWILITLNNCYDNSNDENEKIIIKYSIAHVYKLQGNFELAESSYLSVLESRKLLLGIEHESTLHTMFNLGSFYDDNDMFDKAESIYIETLDISKKVLTEYHPYSIGVSNNLAALYMNSPSNVGLIKVTIDQLFINDVENAGTLFDVQDPAIIITINDQILKTNRIQEGGTSGTFNEVFEIMAYYSDEITIQVVNMDGFGFTKNKIGSGSIKIYQAVPNIDDQVTYIVNLKNSKGQFQGICQMVLLTLLLKLLLLTLFLLTLLLLTLLLLTLLKLLLLEIILSSF